MLIHCNQGVSRSCSFCIAYIMWDQGLPYIAAHDLVKAKRPVCSPNVGFAAYLLAWAKQRPARPTSNNSGSGMGEAAGAVSQLYRMAIHGIQDPTTVVPKICREPSDCQVRFMITKSAFVGVENSDRFTIA